MHISVIILFIPVFVEIRTRVTAKVRLLRHGKNLWRPINDKDRYFLRFKIINIILENITEPI